MLSIFFFFSIVFLRGGRALELAEYHEYYRKAVAFGPITFDPLYGVVQTHVKTVYYPNDEYGRVYTVVQIGDCAPTLETAANDHWQRNLSACRNVPVVPLEGEDLYHYLFNQTEPTSYNASHLVDETWARYPLFYEKGILPPVPTDSLHASFVADGIQWGVNGTLAELHDGCTQNGERKVVVLQGPDTIQYFFNLSIGWISEGLMVGQQHQECRTGQYAVHLNRHLRASTAFEMADGGNFDFKVSAVSYEACPLSECLDRPAFGKAYHYCSAFLSPYRLKVVAQLETPILQGSDGAQYLEGIVGPDDIQEENNGCYGFPAEQPKAWTIGVSGAYATTTLEVTTACLSVDKGFMLDCGRFHTCDVNEDGFLSEADHLVTDYSMRMTLHRCHVNFIECLQFPRSISDETCAQYCPYSRAIGNEHVPLNIHVQHDECPFMDPVVPDGPGALPTHAPSFSPSPQKCEEKPYFIPFIVVVSVMAGAAILALCCFAFPIRIWTCKREKKRRCGCSPSVGGLRRRKKRKKNI